MNKRSISLRALCILFSITLVCSATAQFRIIDTTRTWNVLQSANKKETICYKFTNDTLIRDTTFFVLRYSHSESFEHLSSSLVGFVREDTAKKRVFLRFNTGESFMIYNFKPDICEIVNIPAFDYSNLISFLVEFSDTILIDGTKRRRMFLESLDKSAARDQVWIEGVGSTVGLIQTAIVERGDFSSKMLCCKANGKVIWQSNDGTCYYSNVDKSNSLVFKKGKDDKNAVVMPLDFSAINLKIRVYSIDGNIIITKKIKNKNDLSFDKFKPGIYLIELTDYFDKIYYTKKIKI